MSLLRQVVKLAVLPYGLIWRDRRPGAVILVYHRVGGGTRTEIDLALDLFARQMAYLRRHCQVSSLDAVVEEFRQGRLGERSSDLVVVSFDDGVREVYDHAFPVLRDQAIPVTLYLATQYLEAARPFPFRGYPASGRQGAQPLSWDQVGRMMESGLVTLGSHTHTHRDLSRLSPAAVEEELEHADGLIRRRLGVTPAHFAYPWGRPAAAAHDLIAARYRSVALGGTGRNPFTRFDPAALVRCPIQRSDGYWLFPLKLRSYLDGEEWFRRAAHLGEREREAPGAEPA